MYPIQLFRSPGPYGIPPKSFEVRGANGEDEALALIDKGWSLSIAEALGAKAPEEKPETFDHDGDGENGGSSVPEGDKGALNAKRAEYQKALGKKPFPGWDIAELQRRIDEKDK